MILKGRPLYNLMVSPETIPMGPLSESDFFKTNFEKTLGARTGNFYVTNKGCVVRGERPNLGTYHAELGIDGCGGGPHLHIYGHSHKEGIPYIDHFETIGKNLFLRTIREDSRIPLLKKRMTPMAA